MKQKMPIVLKLGKGKTKMIELVEFKFDDSVAYVNPEQIIYLTPQGENNTYIQMQNKTWIVVNEPIKEAVLKLANFRKE